jgi:hypothetical protein
MKTKTIQKTLKVFALCILFLCQSHLMAQSSQTLTQTVCAGSLSEPYLVNPTSPGSTYQWTLSAGGAITTGQGSNSITIDWGTAAGGPHTLEVIESNAGCSSTLITLDISIVDGPTAYAGGNGDICVGNNYTLSGASTNGTGAWATSGDGTFTNSPSANSDYTPGPSDILNGSVVLTWTVTGSAPSSLTCNSVTSSMILNIVHTPTAFTGPNDVICGNNPYSLSSATATNQLSVLWTTSGDGAFTNSSSLNPDYIPGANDVLTGAVDLTLSVTGNTPCFSILSTMTLTVTSNPMPGPIFHN